jgi:hypothetical protein
MANADHIQTEAAHAFIDGIRDREVKQHLLLGGDRTLNEALNQAMTLEATKATAWPTSRKREVTRVLTGRPPTPPERRRNERPVCWQCGKPGHFWRDCTQRPPEEMGQDPGTSRGVSEPSITPRTTRCSPKQHSDRQRGPSGPAGLDTDAYISTSPKTRTQRISIKFPTKWLL